MKVKQSLSNWLKGSDSSDGSNTERSTHGWFKSASSSTLADDFSQKSCESQSEHEGIGSKVILAISHVLIKYR